tara:strand:+ start:258 stop:695 length:438 start_codon:yes stop_codon:yes gene_type:complete
MTGSRLLSGSGFMMSLALGCFLFVGCSQTPGSHKQRTDVNVTITENGAPLTEGVVNLVNEETGEGGGGTLNSEGVATISGVALGSYTLIVLPPDESVIPPEPGQPAPEVKEYLNIPQKFRDPKTSPFKVVVNRETTEFQFDLKQK